MSLSKWKNLQLEEHSYCKKQERVRRKNECCFKDCKNDSISHNLFTFPSCVGVCEESIARVRTWVERSQNDDIASENVEFLHKRYYVCSDHFATNSFIGQNKKRLKPGTVPCPILRPGCEGEIGKIGNVMELSGGDDEVMLELTGGDNEVRSPEREVSENLILSHSVNCELTNNVDQGSISCHQNSVGKHVAHDHIYFKRQLSVESENENKKRKIECCMRGCENTNNAHRMFHFPKVIKNAYGHQVVHDSNFKRYMEWAVRSGRSEFLMMDPIKVQSRYFVCDNHFDSSSFTNSMKSRLKYKAIPNENVIPILSSALISEFKLNMEKWKGSSFDKNLFTTEESCAYAFDEDMGTLKWKICSECKTKSIIRAAEKTNKCYHGSRCWEYSKVNNMDPGEVPEELQDLSYIEEQIIARIHPQITVFKVKGHQYSYKGNVISFPQDVQELASQLPHRIDDLTSVMCLKYKNYSGDYHEFNVRAGKVKRALEWLKKYNPYYKDISISQENLKRLPSNGNVFDRMHCIITEKENLSETVDDEGECDNEIECDEIVDRSEIHQSGVANMNSIHQDDIIKKKLNWPTISNEPVKEGQTPGFFPCAFPTLFSYGTADLNDERLKDVKMANYIKHLMTYYDDRFASHLTFRFFAYNVWMRNIALQDGNVFVKNNPEFQNMTIGELKEKISENENVMKQIMFQASNLKGSEAYWRARANELQDMVEQLGLPTIFRTLSAADRHWDDLYRLLSEKDVSLLTESERRRLVQQNPHIVDSFFAYRVESFIKNVMQTKFKVVDYWYRVEYQHRGSPHIHGIFWIKDAPDVSDLENSSEEHVQNVIDYFSELVEAWNPNVNVANSDTHPCRKTYQHIEDFEEDLAQLLTKVQRHTKCSNDYCFRVNKKTHKRECRFKFPRDMQDEATIQKGDNDELQFKPRTNDPRLNKFNKFIIQLWRANIDIAPVISKHALIAYLAKYISKGEVQSKTLNEIFEGVLSLLDDNARSKKAIHKVLMKSCAERDVSAQEVCHSLLRLKLYSAGGRNFTTINMSKKKWIQIHDEERNGTATNVIEKYQNRPDRLESLSMWQCTKQYNPSTWSKSKKENIVRVLPKFIKKQDGDNEAYYRQNVLLHVPWRNEVQIRKENETWEDIFTKHDVESKMKSSIILNTRMEKCEEDDYESESDDGGDEWNENLNDELLASRLGPKKKTPLVDLGNREIDTNFNWHEVFNQYEKYGSMAEFEGYIEKIKSQSCVKNTECSLPNVQFSKDQQVIIDLLKQQLSELKTSSSTTIKRIIVQGKAGTGKSLIIKFLTSMLNTELGPDSFLLAAPTGVSAILINGNTLHSIFKLPRNSKDYKPLTGEAARKMTETMKNVKYLILDEYSLIGCNTLSQINRRCKEALGNDDEDFGGINVMLLGDIKQLPPVKDYSFVSKTQKSMLGKEGKCTIMNFQKMFTLTTCHRQQNDHSLLNVLDRISEGTITKSDYNFLQTRFRTHVSDYEKNLFTDVIRLFATKEEVKNYNLNKLRCLKDPHSGLSVPVAKIEGKHNCSSAKQGSTESAEGLDRTLYVAKGSRIMLRSNLWLDQNLCNGSLGNVVDVLYNGDSEFPSVILCKFDSYSGPSLIPGTNIVPIKPVLRSWINSKGVNCTRYQFPITLSYACSVHKSQGMTLNKVVVDLGPKPDFALGLTYVALSRIRCIEDLILEPFTYKRFQPTLRQRVNIEIRNDFLTYFRKVNRNSTHDYD